MSKAKSTPMTREAANRIASATAIKNGGMIPPKHFTGRADATVQRERTGLVSGKSSKP